jgi:hypothetical protein
MSADLASMPPCSPPLAPRALALAPSSRSSLGIAASFFEHLYSRASPYLLLSASIYTHAHLPIYFSLAPPPSLITSPSLSFLISLFLSLSRPLSFSFSLHLSHTFPFLLSSCYGRRARACAHLVANLQIQHKCVCVCVCTLRKRGREDLLASIRKGPRHGLNGGGNHN